MPKLNCGHSTIYFFLTLWVALLFTQIFKIITPEVISHFSAKIEFIFHILTILFFFKIYKKTSKNDQRILLWLFIVSLFLFLNDLAFYFSVYLQNKYILSYSFEIFLLGFIPYFIWLLAFNIFLYKMLREKIYRSVRFIKLIPFFALINLIIIFLFFSSINYAFNYLSWECLFHLISFTAEFIAFDCALLCLIHSEHKGLSCLLLGFIILISGDAFINYSFLSQTEDLLVYGELLWFLGLILIFSGLYFIHDKKDFVIQNWFSKNNSIKNNLAFWSFGTSIASFLFFFVIAYLFSAISKKVFLGLPMFVMAYSFIMVFISIFMGRHFEEPFKRLASNIEGLMVRNEKTKKSNYFSIEEFSFLEKAIVNANRIKEERDLAQKKLGEIAAQVAHDIRSPVAALNICLKMLPQIPEEQRILMRNAANRINDIANNLLLQHKENGSNSSDALNTWLLSPIVETLISEKRVTFGDKNLSIEPEITQQGFFTFAEFNPTEMKRLLSNLINNSVEAMSGHQHGVIKLSLDIIHEKIHLAVSDNGSGISQEVQEKILANTLESTKEQGNGLGLSHAKKTIEALGGSIRLISSLGHGTQVLMTLPSVKPPSWIISDMKVSSATPIAILDDDPSVHGAWDNRLYSVSKNLKIYHFYNSSDFLTWYEKQSQSKIQIFSDYELLGDSLTGLDVLEKLELGQPPVLVTSHHENQEIIERCEKNGIKLLPKNLLAHVSIVLSKNGAL